MNKLRIAIITNVLILLGVVLVAQKAEADLTIRVQEVGSDVVFTHSGTLNIPVAGSGGFSEFTRFVIPKSGVISLGVNDPFFLRIGNIRLCATPLGDGDRTNATSASGDGLHWNGTLLGLPNNSNSGDPFSGTTTFANQTFSSMGLTPGTYVWTVKNTSNEFLDSVTFLIGEPPFAPSNDACPVPELDPDSDGDGVIDDDDLCSGTAANDAVDANGCSDDQVDGDGDGACDPGAASDGPSMCTGTDAFPDDPDESSDTDNDGVGDNADQCNGTASGDPVDTDGCSADQRDDDGDGVLGANDLCSDTVIPESVPTRRLGTNRWALTDDNDPFDFDTTAPRGRGPNRSYNTTDTGGCSCEQIIEEQGLGKGHTKFGCSISAMDDWVALVAGAPKLAGRSGESEPQAVIPDGYALEQNYPNPFNPTTDIAFGIPDAAEVKLAIYNLSGQLVRTLVSGQLSAGNHKVTWNATDDKGLRVATGIYLYVLKSGSVTIQKKLTLMK